MRLGTQWNKIAWAWGRLPTKSKYAVVAATAIFVGTIVRLNIENWATDIGIHQLYRLRPPQWLMSVWSIIFGHFGIGFVLGALLFAFWDPLTRWLTGYDTKVALHTLFKEGVGCRNALLCPIEGFDNAQERAHMVDWSDRTVRAMKDANVSLRRWSRFEILDRNYDPEVIGTPDRSAQQIKLEVIWNKKLDLLREAIDEIGG